MKNIFKVLFLSILLVTIASCDNEDTVQLTLAPQGSGEITQPVQGTSIILNPLENQKNPSLAISWKPSSYGTPTEIIYTVEVAIHGTNFESPFAATSTSSRSVTWNVGELNNIVVSAGLSPFVEGEIDIRILSTVGTKGTLLQTSEPVTIFVTPFTTDLPKLAVPGEHQDWNPNETFIASSEFGKTDYEGYMWLTNVKKEGFKFVGPDANGIFAWGAGPDYGDDGTNSGKLVADDEVNCKVEKDGYYLVKADTKLLTYSTTPISWGLIGGSIPETGWGSDIDMEYDAATSTLKLTLDLVNPPSDGGIKFRPNNDWPGNFGDNGADGKLEVDGANIEVPSDGNYTVTLDLSKPRKYTYSLVKN